MYYTYSRKNLYIKLIYVKLEIMIYVRVYQSLCKKCEDPTCMASEMLEGPLKIFKYWFYTTGMREISEISLSGFTCFKSFSGRLNSNISLFHFKNMKNCKKVINEILHFLNKMLLVLWS